MSGQTLRGADSGALRLVDLLVFEQCTDDLIGRHTLSSDGIGRHGRVSGAIRSQPSQVTLAHLGQEFGRDCINHAPSEIHLPTVSAPISVVSVGSRKNSRKRAGGTVIVRGLISAMNLNSSVPKLRQWPRLTLFFSYQM